MYCGLQIKLGDETMSVLEIWGAEYQENDCILIKQEDRGVLAAICERERCLMQVRSLGDKACTVRGSLSLELCVQTAHRAQCWTWRYVVAYSKPCQHQQRAACAGARQHRRQRSDPAGGSAGAARHADAGGPGVGDGPGQHAQQDLPFQPDAAEVAAAEPPGGDRRAQALSCRLLQQPHLRGPGSLMRAVRCRRRLVRHCRCCLVCVVALHTIPSNVSLLQRVLAEH